MPFMGNMLGLPILWHALCPKHFQWNLLFVKHLWRNKVTSWLLDVTWRGNMPCNRFDMLLTILCKEHMRFKKKKRKQSSIDLCFKEGRVQARKSLHFIPEVKWEYLKIWMFSLLWIVYLLRCRYASLCNHYKFNYSGICIMLNYFLYHINRKAQGPRDSNRN